MVRFWRPRFSPHSLAPLPPFLRFSSIALPPPSLFALRLLLFSPTPDLRSLLRRHAVIVASGHSANPFLSAKLISLYAILCRPDLSACVFSAAIPSNSGDTFLWNSIIQAHFFNVDFPLSLRFYSRMLSSGAPPNEFTIPMVASASAELLDLGLGSSIHGNAIKFGLFNGKSTAVGSSLVYMYSKCGVIGDAYRMFDEMPARDVVAWTALIIGCVRNGEFEEGLVCFKKMHRVGGDGGGRPNSRTVEGGMQACGNLGALPEGKCLHGFLLKAGLGYYPSVNSSLLSMYSKCESLEEATIVFQDLSERDIVSWTAIVGVYARKGFIFECLELFQMMQNSGVEPDGVFSSCMLTGFANSGDVSGGKAFHGVMLRRNFVLNTLVGNALQSMYCKFELLEYAKRAFDVVGERDAESWNLMVFAYGKMGLDVKCLDLYRELRFLRLGYSSDLNCLVSVIYSCSQLGALRLGQSIHCYMIKYAVDEDVSVANALIGMYARCGKLDLARTIFDHTTRDVVTWNALIAAYAHLGHSSDALSLFDQMLFEDVKPNSATLVSILSACSHMAALHHGRWIHNYIKEMGLESDVSICTALVDMYAKCGQLEISRAIFDSMPERDVVSWNVMISGYGIHGYAKEALEVFREMEKTSLRPNGVTILSVLSTCGHAGLVKEGKELFCGMGKYSVTPTLKHYACIVDLLGRSGNLCEAEAMVLNMPMEPDSGIWGALLGACRMHNNVEMGERIARRALESDPENDGYYILLSNMYSCAGRWEEVEKLRGSMNNKGVRKKAGWSAVELG
ncbi:pentatricopeptide repeat-containing protein, mitochondrial [Cocos nucifera]|uniref:Pentatricopeptide repeat-containing protein, mitochondrial n=1 Tax=Cocos nucifera TaxID=13894 RepID=A0A8K0N1S2_COCNU|nr:pentatricopeptide repeat-containing protein, mitochondrial [Cocos nucifera]